MSDAGLRHLSDLPDRTVLQLEFTDVSDAGLEHLKRSSSLQLLYLKGTRVTDAGVAELKSALPGLEVQR